MAENKKHPIKASKKGFHSFFGSNKSKNTTKDTTTPPIENQTVPEPAKHITKDFAEQPTREKAEDSINAAHSEIEKKIEESTTKLLNELDEKIKLNIDNISSTLRNEYRKQTEELLKTAKSTTLANRMYVIGIGSALVVVIIILSLIGYSKVKKTANDTVMAEMQRQANMEATKYITRSDADILIKEKSEGTINELRQEFNAQLNDRADKIFGKSEKKIKLKNSRFYQICKVRIENKQRHHHIPQRKKIQQSVPVNSSKEL